MQIKFNYSIAKERMYSLGFHAIQRNMEINDLLKEKIAIEVSKKLSKGIEEFIHIDEKPLKPFISVITEGQFTLISKEDTQRIHNKLMIIEKETFGVKAELFDDIRKLFNVNYFELPDGKMAF